MTTHTYIYRERERDSSGVCKTTSLCKAWLSTRTNTRPCFSVVAHLYDNYPDYSASPMHACYSSANTKTNFNPGLRHRNHLPPAWHQGKTVYQKPNMSSPKRDQETASALKCLCRGGDTNDCSTQTQSRRARIENDSAAQALRARARLVIPTNTWRRMENVTPSHNT